MQITLNQREIEHAVRKAILTMGIGQGMSFAIEFTNGRAPNGLTATVNLESPEDAAVAVVSAPVVQAAPAVNAAPAVSVSQPSPLAAAFAPDAPAKTPIPEPQPIPEPAAVPEPAPVVNGAGTPADGIKLFG